MPLAASPRRPRAALLVLAGLPALLACTDDLGKDGDPSDPIGLPPDPVDGCEEGDGPVIEVEATLTDIATVARITWRTPEPTEGVVHFTTATGPRRTAVSSGTEHEVLLVGNRPREEVIFRIVTDDGARVSCGEVRAIETGALPPALPDLDVSIDPIYVVEGGAYTVVPVIGERGTFVVLLDAGGQYVWAWEATDGPYRGTSFNADVDFARGGILVNEQAASVDTPGTIRRVRFDGTVAGTLNVEGNHTDFVELPDGGMAALSWDIREVDGVDYLGDRILEIDATGATRTVWNVWDHYTPDLDMHWPAGFYVADPAVRDWSHINAITYEAKEDAYYISMPFEHSVARIERTTGEMAWVLGGPGLVEMPHSVQPLGDNVLVFNRGNPSDPESCSEATEIDRLDRKVVWSYRSEPCLLVPFLGAALRLPNGNTLVDWSSSGQLDEVSPEGDLLWRVNLDLGFAFGFADRVPFLYPLD